MRGFFVLNHTYRDYIQSQANTCNMPVLQPPGKTKTNINHLASMFQVFRVYCRSFTWTTMIIVLRWPEALASLRDRGEGSAGHGRREPCPAQVFGEAEGVQ